jgi:hypothetical protein
MTDDGRTHKVSNQVINGDKGITLGVEYSLVGYGEAKGEKLVHFLDQAKIIAVHGYCKGGLIEMLTAMTEVTKEEETTEHAIGLCAI